MKRPDAAAPLALFSVLVLALTGCAQLPRSSDIKVGPDLQSGLTSDYLYYSPLGPADGDSQEQILDGFLSAGTGPQNDYEIARQYLSAKMKQKWSPTREVLIQEGKPEINIYTSGTASVSVQVQATVNANGEYQGAAIGSTRYLNYQFVRESGQWRISSAPDVTILIRPVFDVIFKSYSLYFFDSNNEHLVPDLRWFPSRVSTGTRIVSALLTGPTEWLREAVHTEIPAGTQLALDSVTVDNGFARVDLDTKATTTSAKKRSLMKAQLRATLTQLTNVYAVEIAIDHVTQDIPDITLNTPQPISYSPLILRNDKLSVVNATTPSLLSSIEASLKKLSPNDFAASIDEKYLALRNSNGLYLLHAGEFGSTPSLIDSRPGLNRPDFDRLGYVWSSNNSDLGDILITKTNGQQTLLSVPWQSSASIEAHSVSPEGSRLALISNTKGVRKLWLATIERDAEGRPIAIGQPYRFGSDLNSPRTLSWANDTTLAILDQIDAQSSVPALLTVGGATKKLPLITGAVQMVANSGLSGIYVLDSIGVIYEFRGLLWASTEREVRSINFPG